MTLRIGTSGGKVFALPADAVTQTFGILAKRGVGKTHTASVLAEEMVRAGAQVVVLDPLDVWWGLRSSADGKKPGLPVYVFGGEHGDLPLDAAAGALMADVVVEQGISLVLSLRHLSKTAQRRFVAEFAERLYHRKGEAQYRTPLHLIIDEADSFAPQRVMGETARMLGAIDDLVRRGRSSGIGVTLISQRAASLNKDVLTQIEVLVALRTISPQDRKALDEWIAAHDSEGFRGEFMASLASLGIGEAWVWSPGWLDVFKRVQIRKRTTFDSSFTPKAGAKQAAPARLASVDLDIIRGRMASVVEQQEANDPKKLRGEIARLTRELAQAREKGTDKIAQVSTCDHEREIAQLGKIIDTKEREAVAVRQLHADAESELASVYAANDIIAAELVEQAKTLRHRADVKKRKAVPVSAVPERDPARGKVGMERAAPTASVQRNVPVRREPIAAPRMSAPMSTNGASPDLTGPEQRVINAAGALHAFGIDELAGPTLAAHAGYRYSGGFRNILSALRGKGLLYDVRPKTHGLTEPGLELAEYEPIRDADELRERWLALCSNSTRPLLQILIDEYPNAVAGQELARRCDREYSGGFRNLMSELCTMSAAHRPAAGHLRATDVLFPEGLT